MRDFAVPASIYTGSIPNSNDHCKENVGTDNTLFFYISEC